MKIACEPAWQWNGKRGGVNCASCRWGVAWKCLDSVGCNTAGRFSCGSPCVPEWFLDGPSHRMSPRWAQRGPKIAPRWPQHASRYRSWPKARRHKQKHALLLEVVFLCVTWTSPRWPQEAPSWPQDGPKTVQEAPNWPQYGPKMGPRWLQDGPRETPRWPKMATRSLKIPILIQSTST